MKKKLKTLWSRRPQLGRGGKTARNLLLTLALAALVWGQYGYPLPTAELEFRRLERQNLLSRSEIVLHLARKENPLSRGFQQLADIFVGETGDQATVGFVRKHGTWNGYVDLFPLEKGPSPVPISCEVSHKDQFGQLTMGNGLLFLRIPEGAAEAEVTVSMAGSSGERTAAGERLENGMFYFWFPPGQGEEGGEYRNRPLEGCPYTLRLYRADGALLLEQSETIPGVE